jgi:hypothetical protein
MSKSAAKSYDRRVASGESYNHFLKRADAAFLEAVGKVVNAKQKYCSCRVREGITLSFLVVEGTDSSDFELDGAVSINMVQEHEAIVSLDFDSTYRGKVQREHRAKVGLLTVDLVADMVLEIIGVKK